MGIWQVHSHRAAASSAGRAGRRAGFVATGRFLWHLVEMCIAMCVGLGVLDLAFFGAARLLGYGDPPRQLPELATLVAAFNMSVGMVAWMRFRGHAWRPILEMSGAMFAEAIVLIALAWLGLVAKSSLFALEHGLMMPVMIICMLFRLDLYTGRMGHHAHAA